MASRLSPLFNVHPDRDGVPLQPSIVTIGIAAAAIVAVAAMFASVIGVAE